MITRRQKQVVDFVQKYPRRHGYAPSLEEIAGHLGVASSLRFTSTSPASEGRASSDAGLTRDRSLEVLGAARARVASASVPLLGRVAAGRPIEPVEAAESWRCPEDLLGRGETFALRVVGDSMIGDGILDGDRRRRGGAARRPERRHGRRAGAWRGDGQARFYRRRGRIHLRAGERACRADRRRAGRRADPRASSSASCGAIVEQHVRRPYALYVHVPWCRHVCPYCDFNVYASSGRSGGRRRARLPG